MNIFLLTPIHKATIPANNAAWNKATDASALENASLIDTNDKGEFLTNYIKVASSPESIV